MARVTLRNLAERAGVSVSAASHAVNGTGTLALATREKILTKAREIGYVRDPALSKIAAERFQRGVASNVVFAAFIRTLSVVTPPRDYLAWVSDARVAEAAKKYSIEIRKSETLRPEQLTQSYFDRLADQGIELLFLTDLENPEVFKGINLSRFVVVGIEDTPSSLPYHRIEVDWGYAVRLCFEKLKKAGAQRIGFQTRLEVASSPQDRIRLGAYLSEGAVNPSLYCAPPLSIDVGMGDPVRRAANRKNLRKYLEEHRLDGLIGWFLDPLYGLREGGVRMPEDLQVALLLMRKDKAGSLGHYAPFSGVLQSDETLDTLFRTVFNMITHSERGEPELPMTFRLRHRWRDGETVTIQKEAGV